MRGYRVLVGLDRVLVRFRRVFVGLSGVLVCGFVVPRLMMFGGVAVMFGGVLVVLGGGVMCFVCHLKFLDAGNTPKCIRTHHRYERRCFATKFNRLYTGP